MIRSSFLTLFALTVLAASAWGAGFDLCAKGFFVDEADKIQFEPVSWNSDYKLTLPSGKFILTSGPIFPGYKLPKVKKVDVDLATRSVRSLQYCEEFKADVEKTFTLFNGGLLSELKFTPGAEFSKEPVKFRFLLPETLFAGKDILCNGESLALPAEKSAKYILRESKTLDELRFPLSDNLELCVKFLSGVASYVIADCRHHGKPEAQFHVYVSLKGDSFRYFLCLLKPGEPFPSLSEEGKSVETKGNLLGEGSGFEVGPHHLRAYCAYSWSDPWIEPHTQPVFDGEVAHSGHCSLKLATEAGNALRGLPKGHMYENRVWFRHLKLDPFKTYTVSAWLKADVDDMRAHFACNEIDTDYTATKESTVKVTKDWKRYSMTLKPSKYMYLNYRYVGISAVPGGAGNLWIDDVQLEEGDKASDYLPEPFEFGAEVNHPYKLFTPSELERAAFDLSFRNNLDAGRSCKINYVVKDYWDKPVVKGSLETVVPAKGNASAKVKIPSLPCGYYRASFDSEDGTHHDEALFGVYEPMKYEGLLPLDWPLGCDAAEGTPIVRKLGFGWTRCWSFSFKRTCPEEGKFNFAETDIIVERCKKANLNIMPVLGSSFARASWTKGKAQDIPDWAIERTAKSSVKNSWALDVSFPKIEAWKMYVRAVVSRYKDFIHVWEVMNEPNCWVSPEEYAPYLKATYEAAKEADPTCLIAGICATSDLGNEPAPWTKRVMELDSCRSMDIIATHMYSNKSPETTLGKGTAQYMEFLQAEAAKYGRKLPVWHTEKSHNTPNTGYSQAIMNYPAIYNRNDVFAVVPDFRAKADFLLRETLIDSTVGKGPFFWFGNMPNDIYMPSNIHPYSLNHVEVDGSPCPELLAANGLARLLEGRGNPKPVELLNLGRNIHCALYEGEKGVLAALWCSEGDAKLKLPEDIGRFKLFNFFGVPDKPDAGFLSSLTGLFGSESAKQEAAVLALDGAPRYLTFDGVSADTVKAKLLKSENGGRPFDVSGGPELEDGSLVLAVYVSSNLWSGDLKTALNVVSLPQGWSLKSSSASVECKKGEVKRVVFPIERIGISKGVQEFKFQEGGTLSIPPFKSEAELRALLAKPKEAVALELTKPLVIDGDLSKWSDEGVVGAASSPTVKMGREHWKDPADLSCSLRFRWNDEFLYAGIVVYDNVLERNVALKAAHESDAVELWLQSEGQKSLALSDCCLKLLPGTGEGYWKEAGVWFGRYKGEGGVKIASKRFEQGYMLEVAIPWKSLDPAFKPVKGAKLALSCHVTDADVKEGKADKRLYVFGDADNYSSLRSWGTLVLK